MKNQTRRPKATRQDINAAIQAERAAQDIVGRLGACCPACGHHFNPTQQAADPRSPQDLEADAQRLIATAAKLGAGLQEHVEPLTFDLWVRPMAVVGATRTTITLAGAGQYVRWLQPRATTRIAAVATHLAGHPMTVEYLETAADITTTIGNALETVGAPATMKRDRRAS